MATNGTRKRALHVEARSAAEADRAGAARRRRARRLPGRRVPGAARGRHRARLGHRHVDRRDQRRIDRRQRAGAAHGTAERVLGRVALAFAAGVVVHRCRRAEPVVEPVDHGAGRARVLPAERGVVVGAARAAQRRSRGVLQHRAAAQDARRPRRFRPHQRRPAAADGRRGEREERPHALLRLARREAARRPRDGIGRAAAGIPRGAHRRRAVLGRRHLLEHADRGGARRQAAPQLGDLRGAPVEPERRRAGLDLASARPAEGHPVLEPQRSRTSRARSRSTGCATSSTS